MIAAAFIPLLIEALLKLLQRLLFVIGKGLCWIVGFLTEIFEKVAGLDTVTYTGNSFTEQKLLINVFFGNTNVNTIYWGMALIGIVMCFAFTIAAVIRKSADSGDKVRQSMGDILKNCFKSITIILLMNFIISATISISSTLMDRINYLIVNAQSFNLDYTVTFDEEDFACMARSLNTIGNYSLNASYNSRYNLNSCYNDIRKDLKTLGDKGKFDVTYISTTHDNDLNAQTINTWQSVLQSIYRSVDDISVQQPLDDYNAELAEALLTAMDVIKNDASFEPMKNYVVRQSGNAVGEMVSLDRMIMLLGSMYGSGNTLRKGNGMTDDLRGPYYYGQKDVFDYDQCDRDFDMSIGSWLYLTVIIVAILFIKEMLSMVFNAAARIFNMLLLYISAPPFLAVTPLDDGGKLKQWTTAFIIQSFGLFGTVISLRLVMIFIPALFSGDIRFFEGARSDIFARIIIMYAAIFTASKASGMIVGLLADNAGMQAINAGDMGGQARASLNRVVGAGKAASGMALGAVATAGSLALAAGKFGFNGLKKLGADSAEGVKDTMNSQKSQKDGTASSKMDIGSKSNAGQTNQANKYSNGAQQNGAQQNGAQSSPPPNIQSAPAKNNVPANQNIQNAEAPQQAPKESAAEVNAAIEGSQGEASSSIPENKGSIGSRGSEISAQELSSSSIPGGSGSSGGAPGTHANATGSSASGGRAPNSSFSSQSGSFETGSSGAARDFEPSSFALDRDSYAEGARDDSTVSRSSRPSLESSGPRAAVSSAGSSAGSRASGSSASSGSRQSAAVPGGSSASAVGSNGRKTNSQYMNSAGTYETGATSAVRDYQQPGSSAFRQDIMGSEQGSRDDSSLPESHHSRLSLNDDDPGSADEGGDPETLLPDNRANLADGGSVDNASVPEQQNAGNSTVSSAPAGGSSVNVSGAGASVGSGSSGSIPVNKSSVGASAASAPQSGSSVSAGSAPVGSKAEAPASSAPAGNSASSVSASGNSGASVGSGSSGSIPVNKSSVGASAASAPQSGSSVSAGSAPVGSKAEAPASSAPAGNSASSVSASGNSGVSVGSGSSGSIPVNKSSVGASAANAPQSGSSVSAGSARASSKAEAPASSAPAGNSASGNSGASVSSGSGSSGASYESAPQPVTEQRSSPVNAVSESVNLPQSQVDSYDSASAEVNAEVGAPQQRTVSAKVQNNRSQPAANPQPVELDPLGGEAPVRPIRLPSNLRRKKP